MEGNEGKRVETVDVVDIEEITGPPTPKEPMLRNRPMKPEGKRSIEARRGAGEDIAAYLAAVLRSQLDAGAGRLFTSPEHFRELGRAITRKLTEAVEALGRRCL